MYQSHGTSITLLYVDSHNPPIMEHNHNICGPNNIIKSDKVVKYNVHKFNANICSSTNIRMLADVRFTVFVFGVYTPRA